MKLATLVAIAAVALLPACTQKPGAVFKLPLAQAKPLLLATELPPMVFGSDPPEAEVRAEGASQVVWIARQGGTELFRYVANLADEGAGATRVTLEMNGVEQGARGDIAKRLAEHPQIKDLYVFAMNERIASTLEHREFDMSRLYPAIVAASAANMGAISASADEAAAASQKQERDTMAKAYADEAAGIRYER